MIFSASADAGISFVTEISTRGSAFQVPGCKLSPEWLCTLPCLAQFSASKNHPKQTPKHAQEQSKHMYTSQNTSSMVFGLEYYLSLSWLSFSSNPQCISSDYLSSLPLRPCKLLVFIACHGKELCRYNPHCRGIYFLFFFNGSHPSQGMTT